jgi:hypothetical protein
MSLLLPSIAELAPEADALLAGNDTLALSIEQKFAHYASVRVTGVDGLRDFALQGVGTVSDRLRGLAAAGAAVVDVDDSQPGVLTGRLVAPVAFSSSHRIRPSKGSELRLGRVLSSVELYMLIATVGAAVVVAVLILLPKFPGRKTLAFLLLFLVIVLSGLAFAFTGNFAIALDGVSLALAGSVTVEARIERTAASLTVSDVRITDESLRLDAKALVPVPAFALELIQGSLLGILQSVFAGVSVTLSV